MCSLANTLKILIVFLFSPQPEVSTTSLVLNRLIKTKAQDLSLTQRTSHNNGLDTAPVLCTRLNVYQTLKCSKRGS